MSRKTSLRSDKNALAFKVKRPCVLLQMHLRFRLNALAFFFMREKVYERKTKKPPRNRTAFYLYGIV